MSAHAPIRLNLLAALLLLLPLATAAAEAPAPVRLGVLSFGTVDWELDVIRQHGLDRAQGIVMEALPLAGTTATQVALQAGRVDVIVADWIWVSRQRGAGADFSFIPYSNSIGAVVVPAASPVSGLRDLAGRRLGIAGGPLDKGWLLLRAEAQARHGLDLKHGIEAVYGAPPLVGEELKSGRIDAVLTYWHYAARLEAGGMRRLADLTAVSRELAGGIDVPTLGYVFSDRWADRQPQALAGLIAVSRQAKRILEVSDAEWERLAPLLKEPDQATRMALRDGFRAGIPRRWGPPERRGAAAIYAVLRDQGGAELTGGLAELSPGTFRPGFDF